MRPVHAVAVMVVLMDCIACGSRRPAAVEPAPAETPWCLRVAYRLGEIPKSSLSCWSDEIECGVVRASAIAESATIALFTGRSIDAVGSCWEADSQPEPL